MHKRDIISSAWAPEKKVTNGIVAVRRHRHYVIFHKSCLLCQCNKILTQTNSGIIFLTGRTLFVSLSGATLHCLCCSGNTSGLSRSGFHYPHTLLLTGLYRVSWQGNSLPDFSFLHRLCFYDPHNRRRLAHGKQAPEESVQSRAYHQFSLHSGIYVCVVRYISSVVLGDYLSYQYAMGNCWAASCQSGIFLKKRYLPDFKC